MALSELYSAYSVTIGPIMEDFCIQKALQNLLWTLSWRPDLGKLVKVVILEPSFAESGRDYNKCPEEYRELGPGIDQAFEALPYGVRQSWRKYLADKDETTAIALLLALSPNVVHLDVMKPSRFRWSLFWSHSILAGMKSKMCLTKLEHLSIVSAVGHECTVDVADFLAVPSLRSFYGARIGSQPGLQYVRFHDHALTTLTLQDCRLNGRHLAGVIGTRPGLINVAIDLSEDALDGFRSPWTRLARRLKHTKGTILRLSMTAHGPMENIRKMQREARLYPSRNGAMPPQWSWNAISRVRRLKTFTSLKDLEIAQQALICSIDTDGEATNNPPAAICDRLPDSLEVLSIVNCTVVTLEVLEEQLVDQRKRGQLQHLQKVEMIWCSYLDEQILKLEDLTPEMLSRNALMKRIADLHDSLEIVGIDFSARQPLFHDPKSA